MVDQFGSVSGILAPMATRGRTLGMVTFASEVDRPYTPADVLLAEEFANPAALSIDNAWLYREAQAAIWKRDEVLASVSHDLKNPLASIKGYAQFLRRQAARAGAPESEKLARGLATIDSSVTKMTRQFNELLDVANLRIGQPLSLNPRPTDLVALVRSVAEEGQRATTRHRIRVEAGVRKLVSNWDRELLPDDCWEDSHYERTFRIFQKAAKTELMCGNYKNSERLLTQLLDHAKTDLDKAERLAEQLFRLAIMMTLW